MGPFFRWLVCACTLGATLQSSRLTLLSIPFHSHNKLTMTFIFTLKFTTEVSIFPQTFPFVGCGITNGVDTGVECLATVV